MNETTAGACEHWESAETVAYGGHCSHARCPNYMDSCPRHQGYNVRIGEPCTLTPPGPSGAAPQDTQNSSKE